MSSRQRASFSASYFLACSVIRLAALPSVLAERLSWTTILYKKYTLKKFMYNKNGLLIYFNAPKQAVAE